MDRIYKAFRFAYETKYWLDCLISRLSEQLHQNLRNGLQDDIEEMITHSFDEKLRGVAVTVSINVTAGSIIEQAVIMTRDLTVQDWKGLADEVERERAKIASRELDDATPKVYLSERIYKELEDRQYMLRGDNPRVPKMPYVIKLAVFYMYKQYFS